MQGKTFAMGNNIGPYSLHIGNSICFGQWYGFQNITLTPYFYKTIYSKVICVYFYEGTFQDKSKGFHISKFNNLKVVFHDLYSQCLSLVKMTWITRTEGARVYSWDLATWFCVSLAPVPRNEKHKPHQQDQRNNHCNHGTKASAIVQ
jgi:hypothetical protein